MTMTIRPRRFLFLSFSTKEPPMHHVATGARALGEQKECHGGSGLPRTNLLKQGGVSGGHVPAGRPSSVKFPGRFSHMFDRKRKKKRIIELKGSER
jgi:hypothetical protein